MEAELFPGTPHPRAAIPGDVDNMVIRGEGEDIEVVRTSTDSAGLTGAFFTYELPAAVRWLPRCNIPGFAVENVIRATNKEVDTVFARRDGSNVVDSLPTEVFPAIARLP